MKNKNAILIELAVHTVAVLFNGLYYETSFDHDLIPQMIEEECDRQVKMSFTEKDRINDGDIHMMKMYAKNYYEQYFSQILRDKKEKILA